MRPSSVDRGKSKGRSSKEGGQARLIRSKVAGGEGSVALRRRCTRFQGGIDGVAEDEVKVGAVRRDGSVRFSWIGGKLHWISSDKTRLLKYAESSGKTARIMENGKVWTYWNVK